MGTAPAAQIRFTGKGHLHDEDLGIIPRLTLNAMTGIRGQGELAVGRMLERISMARQILEDLPERMRGSEGAAVLRVKMLMAENDLLGIVGIRLRIWGGPVGAYPLGVQVYGRSRRKKISRGVPSKYDR